ncbi:amidohydrolase [bacterium]|nr:MAG: amidohydrolase [bacterium]
MIDARVRLPLERWPEQFRSLREEYVTQYDRVLHLSANRERSVDLLKEDMSNAGVSHAIVHAEHEMGDAADALTEAVAQLVASDPDRFSGFGSISLEHFQIKRAVRQVQRIHDLGLIGVCFQPSFAGMAIDDRRLYPVYLRAMELELPVAVHTGINYSTSHPIVNDHPLMVDQVACDFPDLTVIACHAGWPWVPEMVAVACKHPKVLMEFGGLAPKYVGETGTGWEVMHRFMNSVLQKQVLFGTDWPVFPMGRAVSEWRAMDLKPQVLTALLGGNAEELLMRSRS